MAVDHASQLAADVHACDEGEFWDCITTLIDLRFSGRQTYGEEARSAAVREFSRMMRINIPGFSTREAD